MRKKPSLGARLRYGFDKTMAAGPIALIGWLAVVSLLIVAAAGLLLSLSGIAQEGGQRLDFLEAFWESLMRAIDAGTLGGDVGWSFRLVMLVVTIGGIFIVSALIGVLSAGVDNKLGELRKGRSRVLEKDHTIILNWSPSIFDVISELAVANASRRRPRIVVLADKDKVEMEDEIAAKVPALRNTRVICRSGDPCDLYDLGIVNPQTSRSIVVLSPGGDDPDSQVIKSVLALVNDPERRPEPYRIAAEIRDLGNAEVARVVGGPELQLVLADDLISRIVVHSSRQAGLSAVYSELLDFDGCEIYTAEQPQLVGKSFDEAVMAYEKCTPIGLCDRKGRVYLNPPGRVVIRKGVKVIIIAEDDSAIRADPGKARIDGQAVRAAGPAEVRAERTLILGWNRRGPIIARELSRYVAAGSLLTVAADGADVEQDVASLRLPSDNLAVGFRRIDTTSRAALDALEIPAYDHVLVLGYSDTLPPQPADTRTLVTLLHLRKIAEHAGRKVSVVSEMIDVRNRELAEVTRADDFVVSNKLVSLMLAQASENEQLSAIFDDLLDEKGSEFYMRPAGDYVTLDWPVNFYTVAEAARRRGEVAIGYRSRTKPDGNGRKTGGVIVNPAKSDAIRFEQEDRIIVLAKD